MAYPVYHYAAYDISGSQPEYREALFAQVEYVDLYLWYVSLGDNETVVGDHFIAIRTQDPDRTKLTLLELCGKYGYMATQCDDLSASSEDDGRPSLEDRFVLKYPLTLKATTS